MAKRGGIKDFFIESGSQKKLKLKDTTGNISGQDIVNGASDRKEGNLLF